MLPLIAERLTFEADGKRLIDAIDLALEAGPRSVILGPNGAGKSLLLRLANGLIAPTGGRVHWAGRAPDRALRQRQAMVFQRPVLLRRSAAANLRHALRARGFRGPELGARVEEGLARAGLAALGRRPARLLSAGEQQRLALARALGHDPEVVLLDEPTASLDPASARLIEEQIQAAHQAGTKIILVTHDLGQARRLADEIVFLWGGRVEERRPAAEFFAAPTSPKAQAYVAGRMEP